MLMSAPTIGARVVLPSKMEPESQALARWRASNSTAADPCADAHL
jgi:hypothetical protein